MDNGNDILWQKACDESNIIQAARVCFGYADPDAHFDKLKSTYAQWWANRSERSARIAKRMKDGYVFGPYREMRVCEVKPRVIHYHAIFEDNISETAVLQVIEPFYMATYSDSTFGSIKGRGLMKAAARLSEILRANADAYYVQTDCRKYYSSIDHEILKAEIRRIVPSMGCYDFMCRLIDSFNPGIPIGIPSGHFNGNLMLTPIDKWLDDNDAVIGHVRNMDDIDIIVGDKRTAKSMVTELLARCGERKLTIKPNIRIAPVRCGIDAFGFVTYPTHTRIRRRMKDNMRRKVARLKKRGVSDKEYKQAMASHYGWCIHADARHLLQTIMGEKLQLFNKMKINRRKDLKPQKSFFGLGKDKFCSITTLDGVEVFFIQVMDVVIRGVPKIAIKFCFTSDFSNDNPAETEIETLARYTITKSEVMRDRFNADADIMPFAATIKKVNNRYLCYE